MAICAVCGLDSGVKGEYNWNEEGCSWVRLPGETDTKQPSAEACETACEDGECVSIPIALSQIPDARLYTYRENSEFLALFFGDHIEFY